MLKAAICDDDYNDDEADNACSSLEVIDCGNEKEELRKKVILWWWS